MIKRQRKAILFCPPGLSGSANLHRPADGRDARAGHEPHRRQPVATAKTRIKVEAPVTPCELSAKSLMAVPPMLFEGALLAITLLLAVLAAIPPRIERQWPPRVISPPRLRVHLRLCIFRE